MNLREKEKRIRIILVKGNRYKDDEKVAEEVKLAIRSILKKEGWPKLLEEYIKDYFDKVADGFFDQVSEKIFGVLYCQAC